MFRLALNISSTRPDFETSRWSGSSYWYIFANFGSRKQCGSRGGLSLSIIVIIQLMVVTNGAKPSFRKSPARFTLDAMPGKHMSIDADLNSGLIKWRHS